VVGRLPHHQVGGNPCPPVAGCQPTVVGIHLAEGTPSVAGGRGAKPQAGALGHRDREVEEEVGRNRGLVAQVLGGRVVEGQREDNRHS
jgi:hypothetical protein